MNALLEVIETVRRLRAPNGCAWDKAQTHQSLRPYLIEEAYEVLDVLDKIENTESLKNPAVRAAFCEELGDLLMQVLLHSSIAQEVGAFDLEGVAQGLNDKLIRRHPHVFGDAHADSPDAAIKNWEKIKAEEKLKKGLAPSSDTSVLSGLPKALPALQKAERIIEKVSKVGFQWKDIQGPLDKVREEFEELKAEIPEMGTEIDEPRRKRIEHELGDLLFSVCNLSYLMKIHPEDALRSNLERFEKRFRFVEQKVSQLGKNMNQCDLSELDIYWNEAKKEENNS